MTPFDVVLVPFPFADLSTVKRRPCLILSVFHPRALAVHCIVAMMTSNTEGLSFPHDVVLTDWQKAGLPKKTTVRLAKMVTLDSNLIQKRIGKITSGDANRIKAAFTKMFSAVLH